MPGCCFEDRRAEARLQARWSGSGRAPLSARLALLACLALACCDDPLAPPLDLYHNLQGGEIAAQRPPPPGAGLPYPKLGTVPPKPTFTPPAFRNSLQAQLLSERDRTQRIASDTPLDKLVLPPPPQANPPRAASLAAATGAPAASPPATSPAATPPAAPSSPATSAPAGLDPSQPALAEATLATADAPPPPPTKPKPAKPGPAASAASQAGATPADSGPAPGTPLTVVGDAVDTPGLPTIPDAPPPPAAFEGVPAEPLPTPKLLPPIASDTPPGTQLFFPTGSDALPPAQTQGIKDFLSHRQKQPILVIGLGEATSDTPDGQASAISLALRRAKSVADALQAQHVPASLIRVGANAFGRGAVLQLSF